MSAVIPTAEMPFFFAGRPSGSFCRRNTTRGLPRSEGLWDELQAPLGEVGPRKEAFTQFSIRLTVDGLGAALWRAIVEMTLGAPRPARMYWQNLVISEEVKATP